MRIDREDLYLRLTKAWHTWAEEHGQVPTWPPKHGSQTHHMALAAVNMVTACVRDVEHDVLEDVSTFIRMQKKRHPRQAALLNQLAEALEDGSWENL